MSYPIAEVARIAHEINRAYCEAIGDESQKPWNTAPDWQKDSAMNGVRFLVKNPDSTPEDSHNSWLDAKKADGWEWGPMKDEELKRHPCLVNYEDLPQEQKVKDFLFSAVVLSMIGRR